MEMQIDLKPRKDDPQHGFTMNLYIDGQCFTSYVSGQGARDLVQAGHVKQVKRCLRNESTGELEYFDYEGKVDSAGVQYTSKVFNLS